ncbi:response regulator transcription factor [candidate division KSB1 bacterium]|nr:response regulator transcription factor [candidate division KSB1 bacterium]
MDKGKFSGSKILLVEDEDALAIGLEYNLSEEGYVVVRADNGKTALEYFDKQAFDLIIMDIMLPYLDGFEITKKIRAISPQIPILILTARTAANDRVHGLELGADDYLTKPFHLPELLLRLNGMLKRKEWYQKRTAEQAIFSFDGCEINFEKLTCTVGANEFHLTQTEAMVLKYLIDNRGKIVSRKELLENVWSMPSAVETRTVDNFIMRLRKYIEVDPANPVYIKSVRSAGYIFTDSA